MHEVSWVSVASGMENASQANAKNFNAFLELSQRVKLAIAVYSTEIVGVTSVKSTDVSPMTTELNLERRTLTNEQRDGI